MKSIQEEGRRLILEAGSILRRDTQGALKDRDFNMVVRRAQEVVELTLKGALKILGVDYPKVHDVAPVFADQVRQKQGVQDQTVMRGIEEISLWLAQSRATSFYFDQEYASEDAEKAFQDAAFVLSEVKKIVGITTGPS